MISEVIKDRKYVLCHEFSLIVSMIYHSNL